MRVRGFAGADRTVSIVANRWHDNVSSLFFEKDTLDPSKDTMDFIPGLIGSYPSYFVDLDAKDVPDFFDLLQRFDGSPPYVAKLQKYGINRSDERFWPTYDWFQARMFEEVTYDQFLADHLGVMDSTAVTLCRENRMPIHVFKMSPGNIKRVCLGEKMGTTVY